MWTVSLLSCQEAYADTVHHCNEQNCEDRASRGIGRRNLLPVQLTFFLNGFSFPSNAFHSHPK